MPSAEPDAPPNAPLKASKRPHTAAILLLALLTRLAMMVYVLRHFPRGWLFNKGMELGILGRLLALGQGFNSPFGGDTGPTAFLAPGYPFVVSIVFRIFGVYTRQSVYAILFLHIACGVATVWLVMHIARRTMGVRTANVAGLIWALSVPLVWMPVIFWDTSASTLLLTGMAAIALRLSRRPALLLWIAAGLYCGLTSLINPSLSLALLALLGWAAWQTGHAWRRSSLRAGARPTPAHGLYTPAIALLVMFAVFLPWPIRNARVFHAFIPFRSNLGYELWNGNQPGGSGRFIEALHPMLSEAEYDEYAALGEVAYMREKSDLGKASIRAHKVEFMRTSAWRVMAFWMGLAQGSVENSGIVTFHAVVTSCLGFAGLLVLFRRKRRLAWLFLLPLLVFPLPYYVTHPDFRFRLLLDPLVTILAAYALTSAWAFWRRHHPESSPARQAWF